MEATPQELDATEIKAHFASKKNVLDVHDLHVSTIQTGIVTLSAHVTVADGVSEDERAELLHQLEACARQHFHLPIVHCTFQFDPSVHPSHEDLRHNG